MQFVGYDSSAPALLASHADPGERTEVEAVSLAAGEHLAYRLDDRRCAGAVHDGVHRACGVSDAPYCADHRDRWPCARCTGDCDRPIENCRRPHVVYLAAFAPATFKVGVTKRGRLERRLREQGADRGAHIESADDGRAARRSEAEIAEQIPDRIRVTTKIEGLGRPVDEDAWTDLLSAFDPMERHEFDYDLDLSERPVSETLTTGRVRGTKGRIVVVENAGTTYAVDARELVGRVVTAEAADRRLQSSLGAF